MSKNKKVIIAATIFSLMLTVIILSSAIVKSYSITIIDTGNPYTSNSYLTNSDDPIVILEEAKIKIGVNDKIELTDNEGSGKSKTLKIVRANEIPITVKGKTKEVIAFDESSVEDVLNNNEIKYDKNDIIIPELDEEIDLDTEIEVIEVKIKEKKSKKSINYKENVQYSKAFKTGVKQIVVEGKKGIKEVTVQEIYHNGKLVKTKQVDNKIIKKPVDKKVIIGNNDNLISVLTPPKSLELDKNGNPVKYKQKLVGKATAYSSRGRPTSLVPGNVSMNINKFPKGTKLYIKTPDGGYVYGYSEVRDTGTALMQGICLVDLFFSTYQESVNFGAKTVEVYIL